MKALLHYTVPFLFGIFFIATAEAQLPRGIPRIPRGGGGGGGTDTLKRRDKFEDSVTITYRYLDSTRNYSFDSTLSDFSRFPIPANYVYLGNVGNAARPILFSPSTKIGWDPGFHSYDVYRWKVENIRFFNTTRPYTELGYIIGSRQQQIIDLIHTQNVKPYWNLAFQYRLINSPGVFLNQNTNHNNYVVSSWYQSPKKRYNNFVAVVANKLQSSESGGMVAASYLDSPFFQANTIPTKLGNSNDASGQISIFNPTFNTSNKYKESTFLLRQQYDLGRKDSLVTDSTVIPLFYPRLRFEHTFKTGKYNYKFSDIVADSSVYKNYYNLTLSQSRDAVSFTDDWRELSNDFSIYQFPDAKNLHQFIKLGIEYQLVKGAFDSGQVKNSFHNFIGHGEYRNRSRNQKWDIEAFGKLYLNGNNAGDYHGYISLERLLSKSIGSLRVGFENINRSPSYIYDGHSSFYLDTPSRSFSKENTVHFFGALNIPKLKMRLRGDYFLIGNYLYLSDYYRLKQESALFNFLRISANMIFKVGKHWNLYSDLWMQQKTGTVDLHTPLVFTRHRLAYEGTFFKNLNISTGLDVRYHTPYKADDYSPVLGQFFYQDSTTISNLPQADAFLHFRIRSFKAYIRAENLNTLEWTGKGLNFTNYNLAAPDYAYPGLVIRFGIYWSFVN